MHNQRRSKSRFHLALCLSLLFSGAAPGIMAGQAASSQETVTKTAAVPGTAFTADQLNALLPATVYFEGRNAPLQLRNAGGGTFVDNQIIWVSLVDSSGYASSVQERYQFYLVSEGPLRVGKTTLAAGAYGGGFLGDRFVIMDLGGHTVAEGAVETDAALSRPRPLRLLMLSPTSARLYLGRHYVQLQASTNVAVQ